MAGKTADKTVAEAVKGGGRAEVLRALQRKLAAEIELASGTELAALVHQLRMVTAELKSEASPERSVVDEIASRRAARKASAARKTRTQDQ